MDNLKKALRFNQLTEPRRLPKQFGLTTQLFRKLFGELIAELKEGYMLETPKTTSCQCSENTRDCDIMSLMDNQQPTATELAYIAGLFDGEGTFTIVRGKSGGRPYIHFIVSFVNTNTNIIGAVRNLLNSLEVPHRLTSYKSRKWAHTKQCYQIDIRRFHAGKKVIEALLPYLKGKRSEAELVLSFINTRVNKLNGKKWGFQGEEEESHFIAMQRLRGRLRDYTPSSSN